MGRFYQFAFKLVFVLTATIGTIGSQHTPPSGLLPQLFTRPDGSSCSRPCLFGIRPETSLAEVLVLFRAHPFTRTLKLAWEYNFSMRFSGPSVMVALDTKNGRWTNPWLLSVDFFPIKETARSNMDSALAAVNLGALVSMLGEPDTVYIAFDRVLLTYFDNHMLVSVGRTIRGVERLDFNSAVWAIVLSADPDGIRLEGRRTRWLGFTSIERYEQGGP